MTSGNDVFGGRVLKPEYQAVYDQFMRDFGDFGCSCHVNPPCNCCIHEGNPNNFLENNDAFEVEPAAAEPDDKLLVEHSETNWQISGAVAKPAFIDIPWYDSARLCSVDGAFPAAGEAFVIESLDGHQFAGQVVMKASTEEYVIVKNIRLDREFVIRKEDFDERLTYRPTDDALKGLWMSKAIDNGLTIFRKALKRKNNIGMIGVSDAEKAVVDMLTELFNQSLLTEPRK